MKYRKKPEDFIVEEIAKHDVRTNGKYKLYILEKIGIETFALFETISRTQNIPRSEIGIAGIKDAYAKTKQYISIPKQYNLKSVENANFEFVGYINDSLKLGDLLANKFIVTVREIEEDELEEALVNAKLVKLGLPNYFDSQRFGSVVHDQFVGKFLVKKDYESAVKQFLTSYADSDSEERARDKDLMHESWPKFNVTIRSFDFKKVVNAYKNTKKWIVAYKHISPSLRQLFVSSYQSYIWNECIKLLLKEKVSYDNLDVVPYAVNDLFFNKTEIENLPKTFQTMSHRIQLKDYEKEIIEKVLESEGVKIEEFNIRQTGNFFKSSEREVMIYPHKFEISKPIQSGKKYTITLSFTLSKGSYATVVLKKVFGQ